MTLRRLCLTLQGAVQGVGFRPFVYRLAINLDLKGWVNNSAQGVEIEVEGPTHLLNSFLGQLKNDLPPRAVIEMIECTDDAPIGYTSFEIRPSTEGSSTALLLPDIATCADCLREIFDPCDRRYRYPFTNCTNCGPRYSIIQSLPYDRHNATMRHFKMCPDCQSEYTDPLSRRFHAQPNACPICGPQVELWNEEGQLEEGWQDEPIQHAAEAIRQGKILAVKGLGGFHLMVDARNQAAVERLRERKHRPDKPFALMYPSLKRVRHDCEILEVEAELLRSHTAPIVLLKRKQKNSVRVDPENNIAEAVAPGYPHLGIMLPYTPLHHLLMADLDFPVVATSGNPSGVPICFNERQTPQDLKGLADLYLIHNRPILSPSDDSIIQVINNQPQILRRARGYAPLPISPSPIQNSKLSSPPTILAVGAHLKNTIALSLGDRIFLSPHLGDLGTVQSLKRFQKTIRDFLQIYDCQPDIIACDAHPDYASTQAAHTFAQEWQVPVIPVQHHYAHVLACIAEHPLERAALGIAWDGSGYGLDGTLWGGEFLRITTSGFERVGYLRPFQLPGGEKAIQEPRRAALGLLYSCFGEAIEQKQLAPMQAFSPQSLKLLYTMLDRHINTPMTSSVGRLFDAIASLTNKVQISSYEGQAAAALESALTGFETEEHYPVQISSTLPLIVDWRPMLNAILEDIAVGLDAGLISSKFHNTLVEIIVNVSHRVGESYVVLTGGCFQNRYLSERTSKRLREENFQPYWHQQIPTNDGGIALGQVMSIKRSHRSSINIQDVLSDPQPLPPRTSSCV
ncbi:Carbamoyltransferase HypF [Acaryochloris thomasi RCC1774]|uniref:Carbamoyltransferase n=1 Tax=Acaryochloris thomasi RCC1774 TaxID=1764569 RepID=A0A2W1JAA4_9CYAN|nr:carbamoyltransferase HypF [Acaryochloris thomasi]PZD71113.1 Carbamoyltransferase HypF [Acaryochloris thomasi RCC1774]